MTSSQTGPPTKPRVLVVSCGGTISSVSAGTGATPRLSASDLVSSVPPLAELAEVETETFSVVPSSDLTLDDVLRLYRVLEGRLALQPQPTGLVITQGTDTLEEVAFVLELLWDRPTPLVLTGGMRNASLPGPDGPANLLSAVAVAATPEARGLGVLVVFNDEIHAAPFVRKSHTHSVATFRSPTIGPVGYVSERRARILVTPRRAEPVRPVPPGVGDAGVALLTWGLGDDGRLLGHVMDAGYRGLVIEAFGGGHLPAQVANSKALKQVVDSIPVVLSSRVGAGELLRSTYTFPGSEADLLDRGLISSGVLDGPKSRVLLTLLLAIGARRQGVARAFAQQGRYTRAR